MHKQVNLSILKSLANYSRANIFSDKLDAIKVRMRLGLLEVGHKKKQLEFILSSGNSRMIAGWHKTCL